MFVHSTEGNRMDVKEKLADFAQGKQEKPLAVYRGNKF